MNLPPNLREADADATISECPQRWPKPSEMSLAHSKDKPDAISMPASIGVRFATLSPFEPAIQRSAAERKPQSAPMESALDRMKRKFWLVVASSLALLTLAGCGHATQPAATSPATTNTVSEPPAVPPVPWSNTNSVMPTNSANPAAAPAKP